VEYKSSYAVLLKSDGRSSSAIIIFCEGDTPVLTCSTLLTSDSLTWRVTYPGQDPISITYSNNDTSLEATMYLDTGISSSFTKDLVKMESVITLAELNGSDVDGTEVQCFTSRLKPAIFYITYDSLQEGMIHRNKEYSYTIQCRNKVHTSFTTLENSMVYTTQHA
jgi:hypothetical protein